MAHVMIPSGIALVLDMDGVIIDSNPLHREAWLRFNRLYELETTDEMQSQMYGKRNDEIVRSFFGPTLPEEEVHRRGAAKEALYREMIGTRLEAMLVPGVRDFLEEATPGPLGLATNAERANVDFLLDGADLRRFFHVVVDGQQVSRPKPDPEIYLRVASLLGMKPSNCVVFEDSYSGVEAARSAGARVVALRTTHQQFSGVDLVIDDFRSPELKQWLEVQTIRQ